jgi:hypothetical protein
MDHRYRAKTAVVTLTALTAVSAITAVGAQAQTVATSPTATRQAAQPTHPAPSHFTHGRVDNPWFPLKPGNKLVYRGRSDGEPMRGVFFVTYETKVIDGVTCRVIHDKVFEDGFLSERTTDWYAQTKQGTVWYFGERTALLNRRGQVISREGSFRSGRDGAEAGIFMPAHPRIGQSFKQENYPGHAEDRFRVIRKGAHVSVPLIKSHHAMVTKETTRLEPGVVDHKVYIRDIGTALEQTVRGGHETVKLVAVRHVAHRR